MDGFLDIAFDLVAKWTHPEKYGQKHKDRRTTYTPQVIISPCIYYLPICRGFIVLAFLSTLAKVGP